MLDRMISGTAFRLVSPAPSTQRRCPGSLAVGYGSGAFLYTWHGARAEQEAGRIHCTFGCSGSVRCPFTQQACCWSRWDDRLGPESCNCCSCLRSFPADRRLFKTGFVEVRFGTRRGLPLSLAPYLTELFALDTRDATNKIWLRR